MAAIQHLLYGSFGHNATRKQIIVEGDIPFESLKCPLKSGFLSFKLVNALLRYEPKTKINERIGVFPISVPFFWP